MERCRWARREVEGRERRRRKKGVQGEREVLGGRVRWIELNRDQEIEKERKTRTKRESGGWREGSREKEVEGEGFREKEVGRERAWGEKVDEERERGAGRKREL